jgi:hypothetical protein
VEGKGCIFSDTHTCCALGLRPQRSGRCRWRGEVHHQLPGTVQVV